MRTTQDVLRIKGADNAKEAGAGEKASEEHSIPRHHSLPQCESLITAGPY